MGALLALTGTTVTLFKRPKRIVFVKIQVSNQFIENIFSKIDSNYNCQIDSGLSTTGIYTVGCQSVVISTYFEGFGVLYGLGYGIGLCLTLCGIFGFMIAIWGKDDRSVKPSSDESTSTFKASN